MLQDHNSPDNPDNPKTQTSTRLFVIINPIMPELAEVEEGGDVRAIVYWSQIALITLDDHLKSPKPKPYNPYIPYNLST